MIIGIAGCGKKTIATLVQNSISEKLKAVHGNENFEVVSRMIVNPNDIKLTELWGVYDA